MKLKQELYDQCVKIIEQRYHTIESTISSHQKALVSETKSSAGDKHETGRAMLQLEMEKAGQQLATIRQMKETLEKIDALKKSSVGSLGAIIETNTGAYYLSIAAGQIIISDTTYFAISVSSPIGKLLLGKQVGDLLRWNGKEMKIHNIF